MGADLFRGGGCLVRDGTGRLGVGGLIGVGFACYRGCKFLEWAC